MWVRVQLRCAGPEQGAGSARTGEQESKRDHAGELPDNLGGGTDGPSAGDEHIRRPNPDHLREVPTMGARRLADVASTSGRS